MDVEFEVPNDVSGGTVQDVLAELAGGKRRPQYVKIYAHARLNLRASREAGHRVYDEVPYILVKFNSRDDGVSRPVTEADKRAYPEQWAAFERSQEQKGAPKVSMLPACTVAQAAELSGMGITTLTALLEQADELDERFAPLIKQARAWVALNEESEDAA